MEMTNSHQHTLLIWRVFVIGNDDTSTRLRDRVLRLVADRVRGLEMIPKQAILFRPRSRLMEVVHALPPVPDALFIVPQGTEAQFPEAYDVAVIRYRTRGLTHIELSWAPIHGAPFVISHVEDDTPVTECQTEGFVKPAAIKDQGPPLPLRVVYQRPPKGLQKKKRKA